MIPVRLATEAIGLVPSEFIQGVRIKAQRRY